MSYTRVLVLLVLGVLGCSLGIYVQFTYPYPEIKPSSLSVYSNSEKMELLKSNATGVRFPRFSPVTGIIESEILAEEMIWDGKSKITLVNPKVKRFSPDGSTVIMEMNSEHGELTVAHSGDEVSIDMLKMWGKSKVRSYQVLTDK